MLDEGEFIFIIFKEFFFFFLEDNKYKFTFIMDQPRSETVFNNILNAVVFA